MKRLVLLLVVVSSLSSCSGSDAVGSEVDVGLGDGFIEIDTEAWSAGEINVDATNLGQFGHTLVVARTDGTVVGATELIDPGQVETLTLDLLPGKYQISCRIVSVTPDGQVFDHYEQGMWANIEVIG